MLCDRRYDRRFRVSPEFDGYRRMSLVIDPSKTEYRLSIPEMDRTHFEFIDIVNGLATATGDDFKKRFAYLVAHTEQHFDTENRWMGESGFPAKAEHMGEHARILRDLKQFLLRVEKGSTTMAKAYVLQQMPEWFNLHATTMDAALAKHIKEN